MLLWLRKGAEDVMRRVASAKRSVTTRQVTEAVGEEKMAEEAAQAKSRSGQVRETLQAQAVSAFRAYDATVRYAKQRLETESDDEERRRILEDLQELRDQTERGLKASIRSAYSEQMRLGKKAAWNWEDLDAAEEKFVERLRREEYVFVKRFLDDIEQGRVAMPIEQRAKLYGQAGDEAFWQGFLYADQSRGRYIRWVMAEAESCPDCLYLAGNMTADELEKWQAKNPNPDLQHGGRWGNGVYSAQELARLAIVPQSGELRCTTNCKCHLEEAERPTGRPQGKVQREPFRSLAPKPVQDEYEQKRSRYRTKRVQRDGTVEQGTGGLQKGLLETIIDDVFRS